eukprot:12395546-Alexandrium_andersonii.AAC.1
MLAWPEVQKHLQAFASFFHVKGLRDRFNERCLAAHPELQAFVENWTGGTFTWRWGKARSAVDPIG